MNCIEGAKIPAMRTEEMNSREVLYFTAVLFKMLAQTLTLSVIPFMIGTDVCTIAFKFMTYCSYILVIVSFLMEPFLSGRELIKIMLLVILTAAGSIFAGNDIFLILIYIYGANQIDIEKVFCKLGKVYIILFLVIIAASGLGIIENWDFFRTTVRQRWGLGYTYPSHTSSVLFMSVLIFCYIYKDRLTAGWVAFLEIFNYWLYIYTDSRAGMMLTALVPVVFYLIRYSRKRSDESIIYWCLQWAFPVCAVVIYLMTVFYDGGGILQTINKSISGRLFYGQNAIEKYGIHLFGQRISWVGWGGFGHTTAKLTGAYDYVDSSFLRLMIENGLLIWGLVVAAWTATSIKAVRDDNKYLAWALAFIAVYSMVEQWLMNMGANLFIIFLAGCIYSNTEKDNGE